jgi:methyl-accepting chemotaxis protein
MKATVAQKLWLGFGLVFTLMVLSTLLMGYRLGEADRMADQARQESVPFALLAADMKLQAVDVQQFLTDVSATHRQDGFKEAQEAADKFHADADKFKAMYDREQDQKSLDRLASVVKAFDAMHAQGRKMAEAYVKQGVDAGNAIMEGFDTATDDLTKTLNPFIEEQTTEASTNLQALTGKLKAGLTLQWVLLGMSVVVGVLVALLVVRSLMSQLGAEPADVAEVAQRIAHGDLDVDMACKRGRRDCGVFSAMREMRDKLRESFALVEARKAEALEQADVACKASEEAIEAKAMAERAAIEGRLEAAAQLEGVVERTSSAAQELSAQMEEVAHGAEEQRNRVASTATAMEEMNATVLEVASTTSNAARNTEETKGKAEQGKQIMARTIEAVTSVQANTLELSVVMDELAAKAESIGQVMNVITDIADQTNLLALNAAIEAARAGDAGRGFAVVADEVRKLAEKTMTATKEVGQAISGIQDSVKATVSKRHAAEEALGKTIELTGQAGEVLGEIVTGVETATDMIRGIATAAEQQSATSEEINRSVEDINRIAAESADTMAQSRDAIEELARQAAELSRLIGHLKEQG